MGFSQQEWSTAFSLIDNEGARFGFPERRNRSVIVGSFNTLKLGDAMTIRNVGTFYPSFATDLICWRCRK